MIYKHNLDAQALNRLRDWCIKYTTDPEKVIRMPMMDVAQMVLQLSSILIVLVNVINKGDDAISRDDSPDLNN